MAKYKTNFDHKPHKWKLFYVSVFFILVIVFFGHFSRYIIDFLDSVDKVTDNHSVAEFSQSVSEIHGKWLESKNAITTLQLIDSLDLKSKGELSFIVNEVGWPINLSQNGKTQATKQVDCNNVEEFMNVLELVRATCPEERLVYADPLSGKNEV